MSNLRRLSLVSVVVLLSGCVSDATPGDGPASSGTPAAEPATTAPVVTDAPQRVLSQRTLVELVLSREDFPYEWVSSPADASAVSPAEREARGAYEDCLGLERGTLDDVVSFESDTFGLDGSFEVSSSVTQYESEEAARIEFESLSSVAGRECYRQSVRTVLSEDLPAGTFIGDVIVSACETISDLRVETTCGLVDVYAQGGEVGEAGASILVEMHAFLKMDVVTTAWIMMPGNAELSEDALNGLAWAFYALADRLAEASLD